MFRAMRLVFDEEQAREMAENWSAIPEKIRRGEAIGWALAEGSYVLLSLLGGDTAKRVEDEYLARLSLEARERFELQREQIRASLENDGKL